MRRRGFIIRLGGAAAWPLAARVQQPVVHSGSTLLLVAGVDRGLGDRVDPQRGDRHGVWLPLESTTEHALPVRRPGLLCVYLAAGGHRGRIFRKERGDVAPFDVGVTFAKRISNPAE